MADSTTQWFDSTHPERGWMPGVPPSAKTGVLFVWDALSDDGEWEYSNKVAGIKLRHRRVMSAVPAPGPIDISGFSIDPRLDVLHTTADTTAALTTQPRGFEIVAHWHSSMGVDGICCECGRTDGPFLVIGQNKWHQGASVLLCDLCIGNGQRAMVRYKSRVQYDAAGGRE